MQRLPDSRERLHETEVIDAWSKIVGEFIAAHSAPVALREGVLYVRVLQPALHYELEKVSKIEILRKLKKTLRRENHPRHPFPSRLIWKTNGKQCFVIFRWAMSPNIFATSPN